MMERTYVTKVRFDRAALWSKKAPILGSLDIELTERCNNNCIHCYINKPRNHKPSLARELSAQDIGEVLREAVSLGCLSVGFTGGEPLLREDFEDLYLLSRRLGLKVRLITNATLITPRLTDIFSRVPPLEKVAITLYGTDTNSYEAISGRRGSYKAAIQGIQRLLDNKIPFIIKGTAFSSNATKIRTFEKRARMESWIDGDPAYVISLNLRARRDSESKNERIRTLRLSPGGQYGILSRNKGAFEKDMRRLFSRFSKPRGDRLFDCDPGLGNAALDSYGHLQACLLLRHPETTYALRTGNLRDAMQNFFPELRGRRAKNPAFLARCGRCFLSDLCDQCPAKSWMETGDLDTPIEYYCRVSHSIARKLGLLLARENAWEVPDLKKRIKTFVEGEK